MTNKKTTLKRVDIDKYNPKGLTALAHAVLKSARDENAQVGAHALDIDALRVWYEIINKRGFYNV